MRSLFSFLFLLITAHLFSQNEVLLMWSGALSSNSIRVNAKMSDTSSTIRLMADEDSTFSSPVFSPYYSVDSSTNWVVSMQITGLNPSTKYFYAVESAGIPDTSADDIGSFTTVATGPCSYSFVAGSCASNSDHPVFDVMKSMSPVFYMNMGDLHYDNPSSDINIYVHRMPYETVLSKPRQAAFLHRTPIAYMWDDHDFCGNGSDSNSVGKENARQAYHEYVPHYPMGLGYSIWNPICQSFTLGRVHFIMTDLRSERDLGGVMSAAQRTWFENECLYARDNNLMICWMSTYSWSGAYPADNWGQYFMERQSINDFLYCNQIANLFIMSGDAHMLAIDNGTNANFSGNTCEYFLYPVFQAAALNNNGSYKGGIYSEGGYFMNPDYYTGQFGRVNVTDTGTDSICILFEGYRVDSAGATTLINSYTFCRYVPLLGVVEKDKESEAILYPNPSDVFTLSFKGETMVRSAKIYDIAGRCVYEGSVCRRISSWSPVLPELAAGDYIVVLDTGKGPVRKNWVKK